MGGSRCGKGAEVAFDRFVRARGCHSRAQQRPRAGGGCPPPLAVLPASLKRDLRHPQGRAGLASTRNRKSRPRACALFSLPVGKCRAFLCSSLTLEVSFHLFSSQSRLCAKAFFFFASSKGSCPEGKRKPVKNGILLSARMTERRSALTFESVKGNDT